MRKEMEIMTLCFRRNEIILNYFVNFASQNGERKFSSRISFDISLEAKRFNSRRSINHATKEIMQMKLLSKYNGIYFDVVFVHKYIITVKA